MAIMKNIPKVDKVLAWPVVQEALATYPRPLVVKAVRSVLADLRAAALGGAISPDTSAEPILGARVLAELASLSSLSLRRVINGSGVVVNTNLGRSPLPESVREGLTEVAFHYSNLEFNLDSGERGSRYSHVEKLLCELTGAEAALVVNNNAAAVLLALSSLAYGKEVVVSRGELVEIGGSFRIPDVMLQSGALLREVGTTNRTHPRDYRQAVTAETSLLLKIHTSNFAVVGFTAEVSAAELAAMGSELGIPVMADVGSGNLIDLAGTVLAQEPTIGAYLRAGVDLVTFSGDKLLGGPQAGIIVGKRKFIEPMAAHQLLRALRIDKLTLAALEGTLQLYRDPRRALAEVPTLRMLTAPLSELKERGKRLVRRLRRELSAEISITLTDGLSQVGGGALPLLELPTALLSVAVAGLSAQELDRRLRTGNIPVVGRINKGAYLLDLRTLEDADRQLLSDALRALVS